MTAIDVDYLKREYIFANNATQLYQRFRENTSLQELARGNGPESLIEEYQRLINKDEKTVDEVVKAYALLIAATFLDYKEAAETISKLDLAKLEWGKELKDIYMRGATITIYVPEHARALVVERIDDAGSGNVSYRTEHGRPLKGDSEQAWSETANAFLPASVQAGESPRRDAR